MGIIKLGRKMIHMLLPSIVLALAVGIMLFSFSVFGESGARSQVVDRLQARVTLFGEMLTANQRMVQEEQRVAARLWAETEQGWREVLVALEEAELVYRALYVEQNGTAWDSLGRRNIDLSREKFWEKWWEDHQGLAPAGNEAYARLYAVEKDMVGWPALLAVYCLPEGKGSIFSFCEPQVLLSKAEKARLGENPVLALVDGEGFVYALRGDEESVFFQSKENFWGGLEANITSPRGGDYLRIKLGNKESGYVSATKDGEERYFFYTALGDGELFLLAGVERDYVEAKTDEVYAPMKRILNANTALLIILALAAYRYLLYMNKKENENKRHLQERADKDMLTDLNNKAATERKIREYLEEGPGGHGVMFVLDLDYFKKINDTMGHAFGDEVLRTFGKRIGSEFRVSDILGRVGGDEFIIFLKDIQSEEAGRRAGDKLEDFFRSFKVGEYAKYSVTASIGAAVYPEDGDSFESLYRTADIALYESKRAGRNRLTYYQDVKQGHAEEEQSFV